MTVKANGHELKNDYKTKGVSLCEFQLGGTAKLGKNGIVYANFQRSFAGDVQEKYRVDAGLRWSF